MIPTTFAITNPLHGSCTMASFATEPVLDRTSLSAIITAHLKSVSASFEGTDSSDGLYDSITDMWAHFRPTASAASWYTDATKFWESEANCPPSIDGMLGGFASISPVDCAGSQRFLTALSLPSPLARACDCGAGIGRVTRDFLLPAGFSNVDLVEVSPRLSKASPDFIGNAAAKCRFFNIGMQDFNPTANAYDCIWIQWVIGHLDDLDCILFLQRCLAGLTPHGVICIKDNMCESDAFVVDVDDSSVTRSRPYMEKIFDLAGCEVVKCEVQRDFPKEIYPVPMYALRAKKS